MSTNTDNLCNQDYTMRYTLGVMSVVRFAAIFKTTKQEVMIQICVTGTKYLYKRRPAVVNLISRLKKMCCRYQYFAVFNPFTISL